MIFERILQIAPSGTVIPIEDVTAFFEEKK